MNQSPKSLAADIEQVSGMMVAWVRFQGWKGAFAENTDFTWARGHCRHSRVREGTEKA